MHALNIITPIAALLAGGVIGVTFWALQIAALRCKEQLQEGGHLKSESAVVPGSMRRVTRLVVALLLIQILCPLLFTGNSQWWVSAGVVLGYGSLLLRQLRRRQARKPYT